MPKSKLNLLNSLIKLEVEEDFEPSYFYHDVRRYKPLLHPRTKTEWRFYISGSYEESKLSISLPFEWTISI